VTKYYNFDDVLQNHFDVFIDDAFENEPKRGKAIIIMKSEDEYLVLDYGTAKELERALHELTEQLRIM